MLNEISEVLTIESAMMPYETIMPLSARAIVYYSSVVKLLLKSSCAKDSKRTLGWLHEYWEDDSRWPNED